MYQTFSGSTSRMIVYVFIPIICLFVCAILFAPQINYWWHKRFPVPLDSTVKHWLQSHCKFYQQLNQADKEKFEYRMNLYLEGRAFKSIGPKDNHDVPYDVQGIIASQAIIITFREEDFLLGEFNRIYLYNHPFPSPKKKFLHTVETDIEDGVLILALDYLMHGIMQPDKYVNIGMYAYAEAFIKQNPGLIYPDMKEVNWRRIEAMNGMHKSFVEDTLGFEVQDFLPLMVSFYFDFNADFQLAFPEITVKLDAIFKSRY